MDIQRFLTGAAQHASKIFGRGTPPLAQPLATSALGLAHPVTGAVAYSVDENGVLVDENGEELETGSLNAGVLFVSPEGNDTTAVMGDANRPWATIEVAVAAAASNNLIYVKKGNYVNVANICPNLVSEIDSVTRISNVTTAVTLSAHGLAVGDSIYQLASIGGADITFDGDFIVVSVPTATSYTVTNAGANQTYNLSGEGLLQPLVYYHFEAGANVSGADGVGIWSFAESTSGGFQNIQVTGHGRFIGLNANVVLGGSYVRVRMQGELIDARAVSTSSSAIAGGFAYGVFQFSSQIGSGGYDALLSVYPETDGFLYIEAPQILAGYDAGASLIASANAMEVAPGAGNAVTIIKCGLAKAFASHAIRLAPDATAGSGRVFIQADKIEGTLAGISLASTDGGVGNYDIVAREVIGSAGPGVVISDSAASVLRISDALIKSTYNNAAGNAVRFTASGATLILKNTTLLVTHASAESLYASAAQTVKCLGSYAAVAKHANVTIAPTGGLVVDAAVA